MKSAYIRQIESDLAEAEKMLETLQDPLLNLGGTFEGRKEAQMFDLRRKIIDYRTILDRENKRSLTSSLPAKSTAPPDAH